MAHSWGCDDMLSAAERAWNRPCNGTFAPCAGLGTRASVIAEDPVSPAAVQLAGSCSYPGRAGNGGSALSAVEAEGEGGLGRCRWHPVLLAQAADGGASSQELGGVGSPDVIGDSHGDPDDARRLGLAGLGLHPD